MYTLKLKLSKIVSNKNLFTVTARYEVADNLSVEAIMELFQVSLEKAGQLDLSNFKSGKKKK